MADNKTVVGKKQLWRDSQMEVNLIYQTMLQGWTIVNIFIQKVIVITLFWILADVRLLLILLNLSIEVPFKPSDKTASLNYLFQSYLCSRVTKGNEHWQTCSEPCSAIVITIIFIGINFHHFCSLQGASFYVANFINFIIVIMERKHRYSQWS